MEFKKKVQCHGGQISFAIVDSVEDETFYSLYEYGYFRKSSHLVSTNVQIRTDSPTSTYKLLDQHESLKLTCYISILILKGIPKTDAIFIAGYCTH